ncbi:MAG: hypothetical protein R3E72_11515 [Steroidobacteraceae bacterium]
MSAARELAAGAPLITDNNNRMATSSVYELGCGMSPDAAGRILAPYDPLQRPDSFVYRELGRALSFDYIARRLAIFVPLDASLADRLKKMGAALGETPQGDYVRALALSVSGRNEAAMQAVREAAFLRGDSPLLDFELVRPHLGELAANRAAADVVVAAEKLTGGAAAVIQGSKFAGANEWGALAALDSTLAQARWTDPWYVESTQHTRRLAQQGDDAGAQAPAGRRSPESDRSLGSCRTGGRALRLAVPAPHSRQNGPTR